MSQNLFCQDLRTFCMKISLLPKICPWRTNDKYKVWFVCFQLFLLQKIYFVCNFSIQLVPLLGCMSLNWLFEKMLSHDGRICLTFLHCVFSNESSNYLYGKMHSHTGYICLTFLHCVFSNESSNRLFEKMHSHTGCNCLIYIHCVFSNEWVFTFVHRWFLMCSEIVCLRRCKVTLIAFVWLFSTVRFQMSL